jgi:peptide/nickel transport system substrate-binding protein
MRTSRREFLRLTALTAAATVAAACARRTAQTPPPPALGPPSPPTEAVATGGPRYAEAPALAEQVALDALPPVEERLPLQPMVLGTAADAGAYGGVVRRPLVQNVFDLGDPAYRGRSLRLRGEEPRQIVDSLDAHRLFAYDRNLVLRPWLCESWEFDGEGVWTLHLRQGLRWSDGEPFTFEDVRFSLEHSANTDDEDLRTLLRETYEVVDDFELRVHSGTLDALDRLHTLLDSLALIVPAHYVRHLLPEFTDAAALQERVAVELEMPGSPDLTPFAAWEHWWHQQTDWRTNPDLPSLNPWVLAGSASADAVPFRRNPYCWQVDAAGQQLPYLDEVTFTWTPPDEVRRAAARGRFDYGDQGLVLADRPWLIDNLDSTTHALLACPSPAHLALQLNLSVADAAKRALANDRRVRQALSLLIPRDSLNLFFYAGLLTPRQIAPVVGEAYLSPALAEGFLAHDPEEANRMLDEAGYTARDAEGYRLLPDGERLSWTLLVRSATRSLGPEVEMLAEALADGGIECRPHAVTRQEFVSRWSQNDWEALYATVDVPVTPAFSQFNLFWCGRGPGAWAGVFGDRPVAPYIRPPEDHFLWALWALADPYLKAATEEERLAAWHAALEIWREELPAIGVLGSVPRLVVARRDLRGPDEATVYAAEFGGMGADRLALFHYGV